MRIVADLHLHSKYSRAVSKQMELPLMAEWGRRKGIDLLATADWTHPLWLKEIESSLEEVNSGVYKLKTKRGKEEADGPRFVLSTEISSIYSQGGKGRRIHNLLIAPSFKTVHKINEELKRRDCNLMSDGRPIIGLSSIQLAELVWSIDEDCLIIPAHIFTPWFAMFGSKSGFDSIKECWGEFSQRIYAIETGLSSDPEANWRIKELDQRSIVSFSDAHSPAKLGRELTVFQPRKQSKDLGSFSFLDLTKAIKQEKDSGWEIAYTVEFYPEEGKYHYSGHRKCAVRQSPAETGEKGTVCSVCGRPLTLGVMHRVEQLAGRKISLKKIKNKTGVVGYYNADFSRPPYIKLVPLMEILAESFGVGAISKKVQNEYENLTKNLGSELDILTRIKLEDIKAFCGPKIAEGIAKVRAGEIIVEPGFDGVFGKVKIWPQEKLDLIEEIVDNKREQISLF